MAVKRPKPARSERHKVALIAILGICLAAILLWPNDAAEIPDQVLPESGQRLAGRPLNPAQAALSAIPANSTHSPSPSGTGVPAAGPKLPRIDSQRIASADPFAPLSQFSAESTGPEAIAAEAFAAAAAKASVRAVYRTSRGAAAIVDDQIIPVQDAKHWIATLRAAE